MPIDLAVIGKELPSLESMVTPKDVMLYALGVGAGADPDELKFVYESGLQTLPTFGVIPSFPTLMNFVYMDGVEVDLVMLLHGEQYLEIRKQPIPTEGKFVSKPKVTAVYDKGKGALVELDVETVDAGGNTVFFNKYALFVRGEGGFGGEKSPAPGNEPPEREPDKVVEMKTLPQQALLYRLSGDRNALHADPAMAAMAGYDRPILHGLCTFGHAGRAVLGAYCDNDPAKFKAIKVRFSRHVFPGETIVTEMWEESPGKIVIRCKAAERDEYCLTNAAVWLNV